MKQCQTLRHTPNRRGLRHSACSFPTVQTAPVLQANPKNSMRSNKVLHDPARFDVAKPMWLFGYLPCWLMPVKHQRKRSVFRNSLAGPLGFAAVFYHSFSIVLCKPFWFWLTSVQGNCLSPRGHFLARQREPVHPSPAGCHDEQKRPPTFEAAQTDAICSTLPGNLSRIPSPKKTPISPG